MKPLTEEDIATNKSGTLTKDQVRQIKSKGIVNTIAALCFLTFIPIGIFGANLKSGTALVIWIIVASLFGIIFLWLAASYLFLKKDGHEILQVSGAIGIKPSGNRNVLLKIGERTFFLRKTEVAAMKEGEEYTVYFLEDPKMPLGYVQK